MLLQGWAVALLVCFAATATLGLYGAVIAVRVLRYWNHGEDTARQIELEAQTWLSSALVQYGLGCQLFSLLLLVLAADSFAGQLAGAMCAAGAFAANDFGVPALLVKLALVFFSGYWLLLHQLDQQVESYPLVRLKYGYLLLLVPFLLLDGLLLVSYLGSLEPDVITSCCGVLFRSPSTDGRNLLDPFSIPLLLTIFYPLAAGLLAFGGWQALRMRRGRPIRPLALAWYGGGWLLFFPVALWAVTIFFSSYIYAMPSHRCPFDILKADYGGIGYPLYLSLFGGTFLGSGCGLAALVGRRAGLTEATQRFLAMALPSSALLLLAFLLISGYAPLSYLAGGGER